MCCVTRERYGIGRLPERLARRPRVLVPSGLEPQPA
jgi:hypothetical protein